MFSSLKVRNFRIYWLSMLVSLIGTWVQATAQSWLVFKLTSSAFLLGLVGFLSSIPIFLLSLFGGVLADRMNKRSILIVTQTSFMFLAFLMAVLVHLELVTPNQIMIIALLNGVVMSFDAPSRQAVVVEMVGKTHLANAIALNSVAFNSSRIIGPALAGILVASIGMGGCFYLNAVSFLAPIIALVFLKIESRPRVNKNSGALKDISEGLSFVKKNSLVLALFLIVGMVSLFGVSYVILMPVFAERVLGCGIRGLGVLMSASGLGALLGALFLARLGEFRHKGRLMICSAFIFSVSLILFSLSKSFSFAAAALVFTGVTSVTSIALINTILQSNIPDEFRGRLMSVFMLAFAGFMPFGNLIAGFLAQNLGVATAILASGIFCTLFFMFVNLVYPGLRKI